MKLMWLGYLVYSLGNCVMKLCIETGLKHCLVPHPKTFHPSHQIFEHMHGALNIDENKN